MEFRPHLSAKDLAGVTIRGILTSGFLTLGVGAGGVQAASGYNSNGCIDNINYIQNLGENHIIHKTGGSSVSQSNPDSPFPGAWNESVREGNPGCIYQFIDNGVILPDTTTVIDCKGNQMTWAQMRAKLQSNGYNGSLGSDTNSVAAGVSFFNIGICGAPDVIVCGTAKYWNEVDFRVPEGPWTHDQVEKQAYENIYCPQK